MDEKIYIIKIKTFEDTSTDDLLSAIDNLFFTIDSEVIDEYKC